MAGEIPEAIKARLVAAVGEFDVHRFIEHRFRHIWRLFFACIRFPEIYIPQAAKVIEYLEGKEAAQAESAVAVIEDGGAFSEFPV